MNLLEAIKMSEHEANICWDKIKKHLASVNQIKSIDTLGNVPPIVWGKFGFRTAGRYSWNSETKKDKVEMNINYLNIEDPVKFIINTTRHELAHCINFRIGSKKNHDSYWKHFAMILGDDGGIYHDYGRPSNAPERKRTIHTFYCKCGNEFNLTDRKLAMAKNGKYCCADCGLNLAKLFKTNNW